MLKKSKVRMRIEDENGNFIERVVTKEAFQRISQILVFEDPYERVRRTQIISDSMARQEGIARDKLARAFVRARALSKE